MDINRRPKPTTQTKNLTTNSFCFYLNQNNKLKYLATLETRIFQHHQQNNLQNMNSSRLVPWFFI